MQKNENPKQSGGFSTLIGEQTPSKIAGLTFTVSACVFFFASFLALTLAGEAASQTPAPNWYLYLSYLVAPVGFMLTAAWYFYYTKEPIKEFVKEQKCAPKYYLLAFLLQVGLLCLSELNALFLQFLERFGYQNAELILPSMEGKGFFGVLLAVALLPAIFEELFFRGILLRETKGFSAWGRILLCGGLFALYHQNPAQTVYQLICGICFALVAVRSGSFLPTVLSHFINNALILVLYKFGVDSYPAPLQIALLIVSALCLVGSLTYLIFFDKGKKEGAEKGSYKQFFACASVGILIFALSWIATLFTGL